MNISPLSASIPPQLTFVVLTLSTSGRVAARLARSAVAVAARPLRSRRVSLEKSIAKRGGEGGAQGAVVVVVVVR